jgi:hypothetical protein
VIKLRRMRWAGYVACMEMRNSYAVLAGKSEGKRPPSKPRHRWRDYLNES